MSITVKDKELLDGIRQNNSDSVNEFYNRYFLLCYNIVSTYGGTIDDARDTFQEAIISLWTKLRDPDFKIEALPSYMKNTFRNIWLRSVKNNSKTISINFLDPNNERILDLEEELIDHSENEFKFDKANECLMKCSPECQRLIHLFYIQKKRQHEIAEIMGYTEGFVKNKKSRCMKNLRECMKSKFD